MGNLVAALRTAFSIIPGTVQGMLLMLISTLFAVSMHTTVRFISTDIHPLQIFFLRQLLAIIVLMPWIMRVGIYALKTQRPVMVTVRGMVQAWGGMSWFWALSLVPLAKATALSLSSALFTVLGAILILGEKPKTSRWVALGFGFVGVLVIVRPGIEYVSFGIILLLGSRMFSVAHKLMAKVLTRTESSSTIVIYGTIGAAIMSAVPAIFVWETPSLELLAWILMLAGFGTMGQLCMMQAYKLADMSAVEPLNFTRLVWAALLGYLIFAELPDGWELIGGVMIILAVTYLARTEGKSKSPLKPMTGSDPE
ncbi:MAG: DMT family transporter [Proteobacteria bacterium]|nr:DMT family transporter [Pseudomonadota bacterium]